MYVLLVSLLLRIIDWCTDLLLEVCHSDGFQVHVNAARLPRTRRALQYSFLSVLSFLSRNSKRSPSVSTPWSRELASPSLASRYRVFFQEKSSRIVAPVSEPSFSLLLPRQPIKRQFELHHAEPRRRLHMGLRGNFQHIQKRFKLERASLHEVDQSFPRSVTPTSAF